MKKYLLLALVSLLFIGCSTKQYFDPENVQDDINLDVEQNTEYIESFKVGSGLTLHDGTTFVTAGKLDTKLEDGYDFLNYNDDQVLSVKNNLLKIGNEVVEFTYNIAAATLNKNIIAIVFVDNSIALYDKNEKKILLKEYYSHSYLNDIKIANPLFLDNVILFPTLDGKVVVYSSIENKIIRTINVSGDSDIKNIIFMGIVNDYLVAATNNSILTLGNGRINSSNYDITSITVSKDSIYLATIDGNVVKLNETLKEMGSQKFKFAKFFSMIHSDGYLYTLESQGYIVAIEDEFRSYAVYDFPFDNEKYTVAIGGTFYFDDQYLKIK